VPQCLPQDVAASCDPQNGVQGVAGRSFRWSPSGKHSGKARGPRTACRLPQETDEHVQPVARGGRSVVALLIAHGTGAGCSRGVGTAGKRAGAGSRSTGSRAGTFSMTRMIGPRSMVTPPYVRGVTTERASV